jgi:signal peptide peptidase SppA
MQLARESIFISAVRSFCTCFAAVIGIIIGILVILFIMMQFSTPDIFPKKSDLIVASDAEGNRNLLPHTAPVVLKIDIRGVIGQGDLTESKFVNMLLDSREGMLDHDRVKAVFLCMDTPGGTVTDADGIYRALMEYKKKYNVPVYAYVDGLCASGGMYIASAADKVYATLTSVIGSVGVIIGPSFNVSQLMDRYGVQALTITAGKDKDMLSPFRPWKEGEDASLRAITAAMYERFVNIVLNARPRMDRDRLINEYGAQIYDAELAQQYGYIDVADSDYNRALTDLVLAAQLPDAHNYQVLQISPPHPFFSDFASEKLSLLSGKITHTLQLSAYMNSELSGRFLYMYQPELK